MRERAQRTDIVENEERPAKGPHHEVMLTVLDDHVAHRRRRHPVRPALPVPGVIRGDPEPSVCANEKQLCNLGILHDRQGISIHALCYSTPRIPEVLSVIDIRCPVVAAMVLNDDERFARRMSRGMDLWYPCT